jgi:PAS domain S-box-containing protein
MPRPEGILSSRETARIKEKLHFSYLPGYASFLLSKLDAFAVEQLRVSREIQLSLLTFFESYSEEELLAIGKEGAEEMLSFLAENKVQEFIEISLQRWMNNLIPQISRDDISLEDIGMISFMRRSLFRNLIPLYTADVKKATLVLEEFDRFTVEADSIYLNRVNAIRQGLYKEAQQLIEKITRLAPSLISVYHIHNRNYIFINEAFENLLGYQREEAMDTGVDILTGLIHPEDLPRLLEENVAATRQSDNVSAQEPEPINEFTYRVRHKNGHYLWFRTYRTVFNRNSFGKTEHVLSISVNVTEEYNLHRQIKEEKLFAEMITELSIDRIQAIDTSFRYIIWNRQCELYYGKTKEEVLGKNTLEVFPKSKNSILYSYFERALQGEFVHLKEQEYTFSGGWGEMFFIPLKNEQTTFGALCVVHDITDIKKTSNDLKQLNAAFEHAEEVAGMGHWQWNLKTGKLSFSDNQYKLLGCEPHSFEPTIENYLRYVHPDDHALVLGGEEKVVKQGAASEALFRVIRKDGSLRYFHSIGKIFTAESGEKFLTGVNRDITEQHLLSMRLQEQNKKLEKSNKELESFNYIASHDLQEPLRKIQFFSEMIVDKKNRGAGENFDNYFSKITAAAKHMHQLINDLLSFSRIQNVSEGYKTIRLEDIIKESISSLSVAISQTGATIETDTPGEVKAIPFQLRQVLENIISNAIKYHKKDLAPIIQIQAKKVNASQVINNDLYGQYLHISIADNGIGFNPEYAGKIFDPFQRLHGQGDYPGTGIGLAICKKIVESHNGFISAKSEENKGSTFDIFLPA